MDYITSFWKPLAINQPSMHAIPIKKPDEPRSRLSYPIGKKPDAYKNINSSSIRFLQKEI